MNFEMSKRGSRVLLAAAVALASWSHTTALAQGGKKGGSTTRTHRLVTLNSEPGGAIAMTQAVTTHGATTVNLVGWLGEFAQFWRVSTSTSDTVVSIRLTLPADVDPNSPIASAQAINNAGIIVGGCRLIGTSAGQPLLWEDELADPVHLPLPDGFRGWAMPRAINSAGVIVGDLSGDLTAGEETVHVEGLIVWLAWRDQNAQLQVSAPTWFHFDSMSVPELNDSGWVAFDGIDGNFRLQLAYQWVRDELRQKDVPQFHISLTDGPLFGSDKVAFVGGINQAGDVAGDYRTLNQKGRDVYVKRLDGTFLSMPVYIDNRDYGTYVHGVDAVNDATAQHAVQVLGVVGTYSKKSNSLGPWYGATWESGGKVRLLKDITDVPADDTYDFTSVTSFDDLNDAGWICGRIARGTNRDGVPAILIRKP